MDISKQLTAVPNIRSYLLLQSRGLSAPRIRNALLLASSSIIRAYASSSQRQAQDPHQHSTLRYSVDISALASQLDFSPSFTMSLVEQLAPDVVARLQRRLRGDSTLLHQMSDPANA